MSNRYRDFFIESTEGVEFMKKLTVLIDNNHEKGEDKPEMARDYMQRAKGIREVTSLIGSLTVDIGKKETPAS